MRVILFSALFAGVALLGGGCGGTPTPPPTVKLGKGGFEPGGMPKSTPPPSPGPPPRRKAGS